MSLITLLSPQGSDPTFFLPPHELRLKAGLVKVDQIKLGQNSMVSSGNEITDAIRILAADGDGRAPESSYGIYAGSTNRVVNGNAVVDLSQVVLAGTASNIFTLKQSQIKWADGVKLTAAVPPAFLARVTGSEHIFGTTAFRMQAQTETGQISADFYRADGSMQPTVPGARWSGSVFVKKSSPYFTTNDIIVRVVYRRADGTIVGTQSAQSIPFTNFVRYVVPGSLVAPANTTHVQLQVVMPTPKKDDTIYFGGAQLESGVVVTPYISTSGAEDSRAAARVQAPPNVLSAGTGWVACRARVGWDSSLEPGLGSGNPTIFNLQVDANNYIRGRWNETLNRWEISRVASSIAGAAVFPDTIIAYSMRTLIFAWTPTAISISVNGSPFTTVADTHVISGPATIDVGSRDGVSDHIDSEILWMLFGQGTLSNANAQTINGYGDVDPVLGVVPGNPVALWKATDDAINFVVVVNQINAANTVLVAESSFSGSGTVIEKGVSALVAESAALGAGKILAKGVSALVADSSLSGAGNLFKNAPASALSGQSSFTGAGTVIHAGQSALSGEGSFFIVASDITAPQGLVLKTVTIKDAGLKRIPVAVSYIDAAVTAFSAQAVMTGAGSVDVIAPSTALIAASVMAGAGTLTANAPSSVLTGETTMVVGASQVHDAAAALSAQSNMTSVGGMLVSADVVGLVGESSFQGAGSTDQPVIVDFVAGSVMAGSGVVSIGAISQALTGQSSATGAGTIQFNISGGQLTAQSVMAGTGAVLRSGQGALSAQSSFEGSGEIIGEAPEGAANLVAGSAFSGAGGVIVSAAQVTLTASGDMAGSGTILGAPFIALSAQSNLTATANLDISAPPQVLVGNAFFNVSTSVFVDQVLGAGEHRGQSEFTGAGETLTPRYTSSKTRSGKVLRGGKGRIVKSS